MNILNRVHGIKTTDIAISIALVVMNAIAFIRMGMDKQRAINGKWRIPERELLLWCACFGALGGYLGMRRFRHKTKHKKFMVLIPLFLFLQALLLALYAVKRG